MRTHTLKVTGVFRLLSKPKRKVQIASYCRVSQWLETGFGLVIAFIRYLHVETTNNYNTVTDFHTTKHSTLLSSVYVHYSSRIYNTGTIKVPLSHTLPIPLHYSTQSLQITRYIFTGWLLVLFCTPGAYCLLVCSCVSAAATTRNCLERILSLLLI
jgi:hypothetical protein